MHLDITNSSEIYIIKKCILTGKLTWNNIIYDCKLLFISHHIEISQSYIYIYIMRYDYLLYNKLQVR